MITVLRLVAFAALSAALPSVQAASPSPSGGSSAGSSAAPTAPAAPAAAAPSTPPPVVRVDGAWARATVQGQASSAAYMALTAAAAQTLVAVQTPAAGRIEIHEMSMAGNVMRMRALPDGLPLPAGQAVALQPGGLHIMLLQLKRPLQAGEVLPLTLTFKGADGQMRTQQVPVTVQRSAPAGAGGTGHMGGHMGGGMAGDKSGHGHDH